MSKPLTVIYNGSCPICSREIAVYRARARSTGAAIAFTDLTQADLAPFGLTTNRAARRLYVVEDDRLVGGVAAFARLWSALPGYGWLARLVSLPVIRPLAIGLYERALAPALFALHRRRQAKG